MTARIAGIRGDFVLLARSFAQARRVWVAVIFLGVLVTIAATLVGERIGGHAGYLFGEFRFEGQYAGIMTVVSTVLLGGAGLSLFTVAWLFARTEATRGLAAPWGVAATGMLVLATDDLLFVHELVAYRLAARGVPFAIGENLLLMAYVAGTLLVLPRILETVRRHWRASFPLAFGLAMFALSVALDVAAPFGPPASGDWALAVAHRAGKVLGTAMMLLFAQTLLVGVAADAHEDRA
jgi:hypothetical protein